MIVVCSCGSAHALRCSESQRFEQPGEELPADASMGMECQRDDLFFWPLHSSHLLWGGWARGSWCWLTGQPANRGPLRGDTVKQLQQPWIFQCILCIVIIVVIKELILILYMTIGYILDRDQFKCYLLNDDQNCHNCICLNQQLVLQKTFQYKLVAHVFI